MDLVHRRRAFGVGHLCALATSQCYARRGTEFGTEFVAKVQNSAKKVEIERAESLDESFRKPLYANDLANRQGKYSPKRWI